MIVKPRLSSLPCLGDGSCESTARELRQCTDEEGMQVLWPLGARDGLGVAADVMVSQIYPVGSVDAGRDSAGRLEPHDGAHLGTDGQERSIPVNAWSGFPAQLQDAQLTRDTSDHGSQLTGSDWGHGPVQA